MEMPTDPQPPSPTTANSLSASTPHNTEPKDPHPPTTTVEFSQHSFPNSITSETDKDPQPTATTTTNLTLTGEVRDQVKLKPHIARAESFKNNVAKNSSASRTGSTGRGSGRSGAGGVWNRNTSGTTSFNNQVIIANDDEEEEKPSQPAPTPTTTPQHDFPNTITVETENPQRTATTSTNSLFPNPLTLFTTALTLPRPVLVDECHGFYSCLTFAISFLQPLLHIHAFIDEHYKLIDPDYSLKKFEEFWCWTINPLTVGAMVISFGLKPKRSDLKYTALLYFQYISCTLSTAATAWSFFSHSLLVLISVFSFYIALLLFAEHVRALLAKKPKEELSFFLTQVVIKEGVFIGLAQLGFLIFLRFSVRASL